MFLLPKRRDNMNRLEQIRQRRAELRAMLEDTTQVNFES